MAPAPPLKLAELILIFFVFLFILALVGAPHPGLLFHDTITALALSDPSEVSALVAVKAAVGDVWGKLSGSWVGNDPCASRWKGVYCSSGNVKGTPYQRVQELRLFRMNFTGTLSPALGNLTQLRILNFMWNNLTGPIHREIGSLAHLELLLLNGNFLSGTLPEELGFLSKVNRFQIDSNNLSGPIPSSFQHLINLKHMHFNNNSLNGRIPKELGRLPLLLHMLLDNNNLSGELPSELSNISNLVILQVDNNPFSGSIPSSYSTMNLTKLSLRNCNLTGSIPDISSLADLSYLDLSYNHLSGPLPSIKRNSQSITTIDLSFNNLDGELPVEYLQFNNLERLYLQNNSLDGEIQGNLQTHNAFMSSNTSLILDFRNNNFSRFSRGAIANVTIRLSGNPVCDDGSIDRTYCVDDASTDFDTALVVPNTPSMAGCTQDTCDRAHGQELVPRLWQQGRCVCAYPILIEYRLKSPSFSDFIPHEEGFYVWISSGLHLQPAQVFVAEYIWESGPRLWMHVKLFPNNSQFDQSKVDELSSILSNWSMPFNNVFGPYELLGLEIGYPYNDGSSTGKVLGIGIVAGIIVAGVVFTSIITAIVAFVIIKHWHAKAYVGQRKLAMKHREAIKMSGLKYFTFADMSKATGNFDTSALIGKGGYGRVYKGRLTDGVIVAIKRAQEDSMQGSKEFYTEIELLSRVHHRNLVSLIGYCDDDGELMLVYEYMPNGTLLDHLNTSKLALDFQTRIQIALGAARGLLYLHTEADPPIYHRDVKTANILLDEKMRAKVADFGLSKLAPQIDTDGYSGTHVFTMVKGTPGYLDPEYFLTLQLTDKSDVYSFGVVLLELITGKQPIYDDKNLVREVIMANERDEVLLLIDHRMSSYPPMCMSSLINLAIGCCNEVPESRPSMAEVVQVLVEILQSTHAFYSTHPSEDSKVKTEEPLLDPQSFPSSALLSSSTNDSALFTQPVMGLDPR